VLSFGHAFDCGPQVAVDRNRNLLATVLRLHCLLPRIATRDNAMQEFAPHRTRSGYGRSKKSPGNAYAPLKRSSDSS
jgi:hypothetical protein